MSLHEDIEALTEDKSRQVFVTERRNGFTVTNFGDPLVSVSELRAILARHPEPAVSEPAWPVTDHEFIGVAGHPDDDECTYRNDGTDLTYCGEPKDAHQLQVQAPVGEGLENGVSDGEREGLANVIASAYGDDTSTECPCAQDFTVADALIAAGYRKPTLPSVDIDAAWEAHLPVVAPYHVEPLAKYDANAVARGVAYEKGFRAGATAIKAHLLDGCDRG